MNNSFVLLSILHRLQVEKNTFEKLRYAEHAFTIAKLSPNSSYSWAELALFSIDPDKPRKPPDKPRKFPDKPSEPLESSL